MAPKQDRWERIVIAIDDDINHLHQHYSNETHPDPNNNNNKYHYLKNHHTIHVRFESSTTIRGKEPISSLFISPHAIELLSSSTTSTLGGVDVIGTTKMKHPIQSSSPLAIQQLEQLRVVKVHVQAANQPSQSYPPDTTLHLHDDIITGPSGIMVQVEYDIIQTISTTTTPLPQRQQPRVWHHRHRMAKHHFMYTVLPFLSGQRRIILAPFHSIDQIKLHRYVHCRNKYNHSSHVPEYSIESTMSTITTIQCTTIIPNEGAHAAFSTEGFRTFFQQANGDGRNIHRYGTDTVRSSSSNGGGGGGGIWSHHPMMASPKVWSHFFIGGGYPIPQSLSEATQSVSTTQPTVTNNDGTLTSSRPLLLHHDRRRMYWIQWERRMERDDGGENNKNNRTDEVVFEATYGLQYSIAPRRMQSSRGVSLNDLFPHNSDVNENQNNGVYYHAPSFQSDSFADRSTIEISMSTNSDNDSIKWNPKVCQSPSTTMTTKMGKTMICTITPFEKISRTEPLLLMEKESKTTSTTTIQSTLPSSSLQLDYWKVQTHLYRPYPGQAYRGTYSGMIQNQLMGCDGINIHVHQAIPAIVEPIWQSLHVRIHHAPNMTPHQSPLSSLQSIIVPWHELDDYHVDFQSDGSFIFEMQHMVPSQMILEIVFDYEPKFINVDYFPADANRGFDIPPMIVQILNLELDGTDICHDILQQTYRDSIPMVTLYSNTLLLLAPLPDMSMPFNVLSFTCTFYVFVIGSLMNLLLKKVSAQMKAKIDDTPKESKIQLLKRHIRTKLQRLFSKVSSSR